MAIPTGVWGIDLGQCALKAIRVENIDGQITATAFDYVEHPKILSQPDADPDQLTREALEKFLSRNTLKGDIVAISIPGQSGLARFVKLPPVEEKKIPDIVKFEAKQQIPFNLEEVVWDYQKLGSGAVADGFAMDTEIGLFAIKKDTVNRYLQHFKDVNVEVHIVQMAPLALCNYVAYDLLSKDVGAEAAEGGDGGKKQCVVALDIGADNSNLVITDGERIIWQRPIPLGGNHFTRALTKDMKLTFAKAEHLKRNATKSPELKQILSSLKPVLNDFVGEVQRSLGYFTNTHRDATVLYMIGLGNAFRLPGLQKFLGEKLQLEVRKLGKLERLVGDDVVNAPVYTENVLGFGVAYGLALQGLKVARLHTNLLPQDIRIERVIRAKKPWAVSAAAAMLLGTTVLTLGYNMQYRAVAAPQVQDAMKKGKDVESTVKRFKSEVDSVERKIEDSKKAVKSIVFGQDERLNWMRFNQFVNHSLPRPDGSNLSDTARRMFWNQRAAEAYQKFLAQETGKQQGGDDEKWRDDLIQANVEAIFSVFTDDLASYFNRLKGSTQYMETMLEKDQKTPPEGKGWVVEVRGYTYHRAEYDFVNQAIVKNLARLPIKEGAGGEGGKPGEAKAATPGAPDDKGADSTDDPITNHVSHVVLYEFHRDKTFEATNFQLIGSSVAEGLVGGSIGGSTATSGAAEGAAKSAEMMTQMFGGGGPGGKMGAMGGEGKGGGGTSWAPLGSGGRGGGAAPAAGGKAGAVPMMGNMPGGKAGNNPMLGMMAGMAQRIGGRGMGGEGPATPGQPSDAEKVTKQRHSRSEFIILFVWKEPTPSDKLLPEEPAAAGN